ncbi:MAG: InlB B-repeat-containing protein [Firmicutes bacterium]|nr:InlB B-repeat-containing protein [Bacillota bacterium]
MKNKKLVCMPMVIAVLLVLLPFFGVVAYAADASIIIENQNQWYDFIDDIIKTWSGDNNSITLESDVVGQLKLPDALTGLKIDGNNYSLSGAKGESSFIISAGGRRNDLDLNLRNIILQGGMVDKKGYPALVFDNSASEKISVTVKAEGIVKIIGGGESNGTALSNNSGLYAVNTNVIVNGSAAFQSGKGNAGVNANVGASEGAGAGAYISSGDLIVSGGSPQFFGEDHTGLYITEGSLIVTGEAKPVVISVSTNSNGADIDLLKVTDQASPTFISTGGSAMFVVGIEIASDGDCVFMGTEYGIMLKDNELAQISHSRGSLTAQATLGAIHKPNSLNISLPDIYTYWVNAENKDPGDEGIIYSRDNPFIYSAEYKFIKIQQSNKPPEYTVFFESNGGSAVEAIICTDGEQILKPSNPIKEGYAFNGWYLDGNHFDFGMPISENIVLQAGWEDDTARSLSYIMYIAIAIIALLLILILMLRPRKKIHR